MFNSRPRQRLAAALLTYLMATLAPAALACGRGPMLNPGAEAHFIEIPDKSVRFAGSRMDLNQDDILFLQVPEQSRIDTGNGDATLNRIGDMQVLESPRFKEIAPQTLVSGAMVALQMHTKGLEWRAFQAMRGATTLTIEIEGEKTELNVVVKPYTAPAPDPVRVTMDKATRANPLAMQAGQEFEVTLPGNLAAGWTVDGLKPNGVTLKSLTQPNAEASNEATRLLFEVSRSNYSKEPWLLSIRRGGVLGGETFKFYLVFYPPPAC